MRSGEVLLKIGALAYKRTMAGKPKKKKEDDEFKPHDEEEGEAVPAEDDLKEPDELEEEDDWLGPMGEEESY